MNILVIDKIYIFYFFVLFVFCMQPLGKGQNVENQNVKSPKVDPKFEKDQNFESQIRLLKF